MGVLVAGDGRRDVLDDSLDWKVSKTETENLPKSCPELQLEIKSICTLFRDDILQIC